MTAHHSAPAASPRVTGGSDQRGVVAMTERSPLLAADGDPLAPAPPPASAWRRILAVFRTSTVWIAVTGLASLATLTGLIADWFPDALPGPAPGELAVGLGNARLEERGVGADGFDTLSVSFDANFTGYKGKRILVEWMAFDATGETRITLDPAPAVARTERGNWDGGRIKAEAKDDQVNHAVTFRPPNAAACLRARIYLYDDDFTRLAYADSTPFNTDPDNDKCALVATATPAAT